MKMEYSIHLDPSLGISIDSLSEIWSEIPECAAVAKIEATKPTPSLDYFELDLASLFIGTLISTGVTLTKDLLIILLKRALDRADQSAHKSKNKVEVYTTDDPQTGLPIIRINKTSDK